MCCRSSRPALAGWPALLPPAKVASMHMPRGVVPSLPHLSPAEPVLGAPCPPALTSSPQAGPAPNR